MTVTSSSDTVNVFAQTKIVLTSGQSTVTLEGGNITFACPGTFTVKGGAHGFVGPVSQPAPLQGLPSGISRLKISPSQGLSLTDPAASISDCIDYSAMYAAPGPAYKTSQIAKHSHYNEPIERGEGRLAGDSRRHGDASHQVQRAVIDTIRAKAKGAGLGRDDYAMLLAIAKTESGFNPDAAAGTTSAAGIGQFIDATGKEYGLRSNADRFDIEKGSAALVDSYANTKRLMQKDYSGSDLYKMIYAYHHDGPSLSYGGEEIAETKVMPDFRKFKDAMCKEVMQQ